jgi:hypothetical protein
MNQHTNGPLDRELTSVCRAFDAAFQRMREAANTDTLQDELSNMLHHMYRLGELRMRRWRAGNSAFTENDFTHPVSQIAGALGALWIRCYDTHEIAVISQLTDRYSDYYTNIYGILIWQPVQAMPFIKIPNAANRYTDYCTNLADKPVLDTLRKAFDHLVNLP